MNESGKLTKKEYLILIVSSVLIITIASTSSPLFPFNPWDDANCFLTMGRGIVKGLVPYRDLYEQKGPILYLVHALCSLVPGKSFTGVWILESAAAAIFAVFTWKSVKLFVKPSAVSIYLVPVFLSVVYTMRIFNYGDSAEELCFPLLSVVLFYALKALGNEDNLPELKEGLISGIIAGLLFWTKFNFVAFLAAYCLLIIIYSIIHKRFKKLFTLIALFLAGVVISSLPVLFYFASHNALGDLYTVYFYNNLFFYNSGSIDTGIYSIPVVKNFAIPFTILFKLGVEYKKLGVMLLLITAGGFTFERKYRKRATILFAFTFLVTVLATFPRIYYIYYYAYILMLYVPLAVLLFVRLACLLEAKLKDGKKLLTILLGALCAVSVVMFMLSGKNNYLIFKPAKDLPQYKFAEEIKKTKNVKILTFDIMDSGFYTAAGIVPSNRFFCYLNIEKNWSAILEEQGKLIDEGYFDYIICYDDDYDWERYELYRVEETPICDYSGKLLTDRYCLYKLKPEE